MVASAALVVLFAPQLASIGRFQFVCWNIQAFQEHLPVDKYLLDAYDREFSTVDNRNIS